MGDAPWHHAHRRSRAPLRSSGTSARQSRARRSPTTITVSAATVGDDAGHHVAQRGAVAWFDASSPVNGRTSSGAPRRRGEQLRPSLRRQRRAERRGRRSDGDPRAPAAIAEFDRARARPGAEAVIDDQQLRAAGDAGSGPRRSPPRRAPRARSPGRSAEAAPRCRSRSRPRRTSRSAAVTRVPSCTVTRRARRRAPPRRTRAAPAIRVGAAPPPRSRAARRSRRARRTARPPTHAAERGGALEARGTGADDRHRTVRRGALRAGRSGAGALAGGPRRAARASGLTEHSSTGSKARQSSLQDTHGRISASRPESSFAGKSGSAISGRAMPTRSAPGRERPLDLGAAAERLRDQQRPLRRAAGVRAMCAEQRRLLGAPCP